MSSAAQTQFVECTDNSLRAFRRHAVTLSALVHAENGKSTPARTASVEDISLSGLFFVCQWAFPLDSVVSVQMRLGTVAICVLAVVRRQTLLHVAGKRCYGCGVQFVRTEKAGQSLQHIIHYLSKKHRPMAHDSRNTLHSA